MCVSVTCVIVSPAALAASMYISASRMIDDDRGSRGAASDEIAHLGELRFGKRRRIIDQSSQ